MRVSPSLFYVCAKPLLRRTPRLSCTADLRKVRSLFGVTPTICAMAWSDVRSTLSRGARPLHLLWALLFLKTYATEHVNRILSGASEKYFESGLGYLLNVYPI